jgi:hypothetical protein
MGPVVVRDGALCSPFVNGNIRGNADGFFHGLGGLGSGSGPGRPEPRLVRSWRDWRGGLPPALNTPGLTPVILTALIVCWPGQEVPAGSLARRGLSGRERLCALCPLDDQKFCLYGREPLCFHFSRQFFQLKMFTCLPNRPEPIFEVLAEYKGTSSLLTELLKMPLRLIKNAQSFGGGYDVTGDMGWALPLILAPLNVPNGQKGAWVSPLLRGRPRDDMGLASAGSAISFPAFSSRLPVGGGRVGNRLESDDPLAEAMAWPW